MSDSKPADPGQAIQKSPAQSVQVGRGGVALQNLDDLLKFADMCVKGAVAPKGMTREAAAVAIQAGMERGLGPLGGLQAGVVINGVLSWRGWAAVGFIQNSPVIVPGTFKSWVENPATDQAVGYCRAQRRGYDQPFLRSFSVLDAKKAGLWKKGGPWDARPDNMLEWRAIGDMGRFHFGDVLGGFPIAEDVEAGGIGPAEAPRELPATREPAPATLVADPILAELVPAARAVEASPSPMVQAVIDAQVDEVFGPPKDFGDKCPRCLAKLNAMAGCDVCGFPGTDNGERP
ncbi:MAG: hypothetical protein MUQ56_13860 [Thermoleophilia bacterium]|nr:hypothetical protein [Thermoleophilia bacterium]